nr:YIP1 family protein [Bacteroidales bacterium]
SLGKTFGGVYFSFFVLQETAKYFGLKRSKKNFMQMAGYSFVVIFVVDIIASLIPELFFLNFLKIYIFYIVWEAVEILVQVEEKKRAAYVISVSLLILLSSLIIERVLLLFMPGAEIVA